MAYRQLPMTPMLKIRINEPGTRFFGLSDSSSFRNPTWKTLNGYHANHNSVLRVDETSTEITFYGRFGVFQTILFARERDDQWLAALKIDANGRMWIEEMVQPMDWYIPPEILVNLATVIAIENDDQTFVLRDLLSRHTDLLRYRVSHGKFYIPNKWWSNASQRALESNKPKTHPNNAKTNKNGASKKGDDKPVGEPQAGPSGLQNMELGCFSPNVRPDPFFVKHVAAKPAAFHKLEQTRANRQSEAINQLSQSDTSSGDEVNFVILDNFRIFPSNFTNDLFVRNYS